MISKRFHPVSLAFVSMFAAIGAGAVELSFESQESLKRNFDIKGPADSLTVEDGALKLAYSKPALSVVTYSPGKGELVSLAETVETEFEFEADRPSFGVFVRGREDDAYLALVHAWGNGWGRLSLYRTPVWPPSAMKEAVIHKEIPGLAYGEPMTLRITTRNTEGKVRVEARVIRKGEADVSVEMLDEKEPLTEPGQVGFRFFTGTGEGTLRLLKTSVLPDPHAR